MKKFSSAVSSGSGLGIAGAGGSPGRAALAHGSLFRAADPHTMLARALLRGMGRAGGASRNLRHFRATALRPAETVAIRFLEPDGTVIEADAPLGEKLVEVALENDVSLECACGGELACST